MLPAFGQAINIVVLRSASPESIERLLHLGLTPQASRHRERRSDKKGGLLYTTPPPVGPARVMRNYARPFRRAGFRWF